MKWNEPLYMRNSPSLWLWHSLIGLLHRLWECLELCSAARPFLDDALCCFVVSISTQSHYITTKTEKPEQFPVINGRTNHLKQILNNNCQQGHNTIKCTIHKSISQIQHLIDRYILFLCAFPPDFPFYSSVCSFIRSFARYMPSI